MGNPRNPRHLHLILLFQLFFFVSLSSCHFFPSDNHLVDCGSSSATTLNDHRVFLPDTNCRSARLVSDRPKISVAAEGIHPSIQDAPLYQTARVLTSLSSYEFHIRNKGAHIIRLHFYPFTARSHNLTSAQFHVLASGFVLLSNFSASTKSPSVKEFIIRVEDDKLVILFVPVDSSSFAFVNAIEVISAPDELIGDTARLAKSEDILRFDGLSKQAIETLFRINVGGPKVTPFNDTLWRTWIPDADFFNSGSVTKIVSFSGRIMYSKYGASREVAPDSVYNTARVIDVVSSSNLSSRMTWSFPVDLGYRYLIRMHFCDIASLVLNELYFNVYINGFLAYKDFDISSAAGQVLASPYYVDFLSDVGNSGLLHVSIGPSRYGDNGRVDGLLNGVEIMKINNSVGSLDGELPFALVLHSSRGNFGTNVRSLICWFAFVMLTVSGFMLMLKWMTESKNRIAWSPLPTDASEVKIGKGAQLYNED